MRPSPLRLAVAAVVSTVAACTLNTAGLGSADSRVAIVLPDGGAAGAGGAAGTLVGDDPSGGRSGENGGDAGSNGDGGDAAAGAGVAAGGSAGSDVAGATGAAGAGVAGAGAAGAGVAGAGAAGAGVAGGSAGAAGQGAAGNAPDAGAAGTGGTHPISAIGCADGAREGFTSLAQYPNIAACGGGWQIPGFVGPATMSPACERHGGDDGARPNGEGCSVADLCADGWHVCEGSVEFAMKAVDCRDALPTQGEGPAFYGTRQRGPDKTCDPTNQTGTNNVYGCGNFGSPAMAACLPFTRMLRDADCKANTPWMCVDGPIDYNVSELLDVTKPGPARGGVLCCR